MKKAIVLLLALAVLGGAAFAQVTTAISFSGSVTLVDQDANGVFSHNGPGYDLLTFKATTEDGLVGFSITDQDLFDGTYDTIRDWNAWYKLMDKKVRVMVGKLRNGDVRALLPTGLVGFGATQRVGGYGMLISAYPVDGLTLELNLPYGTTAEPMADVLQKVDFGAKYAIADVGTVIFLADLNLIAKSNVINFGFTYTGVENMTAAFIYQGTFATASTHKFGLGASYGLDALTLALEASGVYTSALYWDVGFNAGYDIMEKLSASLGASYDSDGEYDVNANLNYNLADGLDIGPTLGYSKADEFYFSLDVLFSIAF